MTLTPYRRAADVGGAQGKPFLLVHLNDLCLLDLWRNNNKAVPQIAHNCCPEELNAPLLLNSFRQIIFPRVPKQEENRKPFPTSLHNPHLPTLPAPSEGIVLWLLKVETAPSAAAASSSSTSSTTRPPACRV